MQLLDVTLDGLFHRDRGHCIAVMLHFARDCLLVVSSLSKHLETGFILVSRRQMLAHEVIKLHLPERNSCRLVLELVL